MENVTAQVSDFAGQLEMRWAAVPGAVCYLAEFALSPKGPCSNAICRIAV